MKAARWNRICFAAALVAACALAGSARADVVDFEDLALAPDSFFRGVDDTPYDGIKTDNPWSSGGMEFHNYFAEEIFGTFEYEVWHGQRYSNQTWQDTPPGGLAGEHVAYPKSGAAGSSNYAVVYRASEVVSEVQPGVYEASSYVTLDLPADKQIESIEVANSTYTWDSMANGDGFARRFGWLAVNDDGDFSDPGEYDGDYPDYFLMTVTGLDAAGDPIAATPVEVYLADYRGDTADDYILEDWLLVDLSDLRGAAKLQFKLESNDYGQYGMNTPAYFLLDNITFSAAAAIPEPSTCLLAIVGAALLLAWRCRRRNAGN